MLLYCMTRNHNPAPLLLALVESAPVWQVYPFRLALNCSVASFHRERARIFMKHGMSVLPLVSDAMVETELLQSSDEDRAQCAKRIADACQMPDSDRRILGI